MGLGGGGTIYIYIYFFKWSMLNILGGYTTNSFKRGMFNWSVFSNLDKAKTLFQSTFPVMNDPPFLANKNKKTDFLEISSEKKIGFSSTPPKPLPRGCKGIPFIKGLGGLPNGCAKQGCVVPFFEIGDQSKIQTNSVPLGGYAHSASGHRKLKTLFLGGKQFSTECCRIDYAFES